MSELVSMLQKCLYIYRREPEALYVMLDSPVFIDTYDMDDREIRERIQAGDKDKRTELMSKALLDAPYAQVPIRERPTPERFLTAEMVFEAFYTRGTSAEEVPSEEPLKRWQAKRSTEEYLISHFLERVAKLSNTVDLLDQEIGRRIPLELRGLVRDCHISLADGNYVAVAILMRASVEWALRDLLNENVKGLGALLGRALKQRLIKFESPENFAIEELKVLRDKAIHYGEANAGQVHEALVAFRSLMIELYKDREEIL